MNPPTMNYLQAEKFLFSQIPYWRTRKTANPRQNPAYFRNMRSLLKLLGSPEKYIPHYIHITGTSGKGSVASYLESIIKNSGQKVGLLTSPHPTYLTERWQISGQPIPKKNFAKIIQEIKPRLNKFLQKNPNQALSFFQLTTIIGLKYFADQKVSWAIIEAGIGGKGDSTNIIPKKDAAIITNIELDHVGVIGQNKKEIAQNKAGIITKNCLVFTAEKDKKIVQILKREVKQAGAKSFYKLSDDYKLKKISTLF